MICAMNQKKIATHYPLMKKHKKSRPCRTAFFTVIYNDLFHFETLTSLAK
jgi:hypothetical protein